MIDLLINECEDSLRKLRDAVAMRNDNDWDLDWKVDKVNHAIICLEKLRRGHLDDRAETYTIPDTGFDS